MLKLESDNKMCRIPNDAAHSLRNKNSTQVDMLIMPSDMRNNSNRYNTPFWGFSNMQTVSVHTCMCVCLCVGVCVCLSVKQPVCTRCPH